MVMKRVWVSVFACGVMFAAVAAQGAGSQDKEKDKEKKDEKVVVKGKVEAAEAELPPDSITSGSVTVGGQVIAYKAVAGTLTVGSSDAQDAMIGLDGKMLSDTGVNPPDKDKPEDAPATARMFYVAYFKKDAGTARPVTFMYNGGPGGGAVWLHM